LLKAAKAKQQKLENSNCDGLSSEVCNIIITLKDNEYGNNNSKFVALRVAGGGGGSGWLQAWQRYQWHTPPKTTTTDTTTEQHAE